MKSFPPEIQVLLGVERLPLTDSEKGGLRNRFGLCYQELYSLELIKQVLHGNLDGFFCERGEDYLGYTLGANREPTRLSLVQVKSSRADCVLCKTKKTVGGAIESLTRSFRRFRDFYPSAEITLRLVLSKHECCLGNHEVFTTTHRMTEQSGKEVLESPSQAWPSIELVFGPPCPPSFEDICGELRGVAGPQLDLERLFVESLGSSLELTSYLSD